MVSTEEQPSLKACIINDDSFVSVYTLKKDRMEIEEKCSTVFSPNLSVFWGDFCLFFAIFPQCFLKALCIFYYVPEFSGTAEPLIIALDGKLLG